MDGNQKAPVELRRATVEEVVPLVEMAAKWDTDGGEFDARRLAEICNRFVFEENGVPVCGFLIEIRGDEAFIMAAGSVGRQDFTRIGLGAIEGMARKHFSTVAFATRRGGLIRKAQRLGYTRDGCILRKRLK
jgi:hypothetical protein